MRTLEQRRMFLKLAGLSSAGLLLPKVALAMDDEKPTSFPPDVNRKFYPNGAVMPFRGNTIICHVPQQGDDSTYFNALLDVYREAESIKFFNKIRLLPPSSYHMTIFGGANDRDRTPGLWPNWVPLDATIETCNAMMGERLEAFRLGKTLPIRMRVDPNPLPEGPMTFRLLPLDSKENDDLRDLIKRLGDTLDIHPPHIETYRFHTTLGYPIQWLTADENTEFQALMAKWRAHIIERCPIITLGAPEYCVLDDMYAFHRQFYLS